MLTCPKNYYQARNMLNGRGSRKVGHNTYIVDRGNAVSIRYHNTDVVTFHADGTATLRNGGWNTLTTRKRFKACGFPAYTSKGQCYVSNGPKNIYKDGNYVDTVYDYVPFEDGMSLKVTLV